MTKYLLLIAVYVIGWTLFTVHRDSKFCHANGGVIVRGTIDWVCIKAEEIKL